MAKKGIVDDYIVYCVIKKKLFHFIISTNLWKRKSTPMLSVDSHLTNRSRGMWVIDWSLQSLTRIIHPALSQVWANVADVGPDLRQRWVRICCLYEHGQWVTALLPCTRRLMSFTDLAVTTSAYLLTYRPVCLFICTPPFCLRCKFSGVCGSHLHRLAFSSVET